MDKKEIKKVYVAGPDVFREDAVKFFDYARQVLIKQGYEPLIPLDNKATTSLEIFQANIAMLREADAVIANVSPFRGTEPDSGTAYEVGVAHALGLPVVLYSQVSLEMVFHRTVDHFPGMNKDVDDRDEPHRVVFPDSMKAECFDLPLNLMLWHTGEYVHGDFRAAIHRLNLL